MPGELSSRPHIVEAGVGSVLARTPGKIYLAGPYHGSATSIVSVTAAKVGPFDLGTVVIRLALRVNPETAEVFVDSAGSDPMPHIVDGIPSRLRDIRVYMDRPDFVLNPTSCEPTSTASTLLGSGASFTREIGISPVTVSTRYQAADCACLTFEPRTRPQPQRRDQARRPPAFKAVLTSHGRRSQHRQPRSPCPVPSSLNRPTSDRLHPHKFAEGAAPGEKCPAASVYGFARAITPILAEPLEGPVYLRSSDTHFRPGRRPALRRDKYRPSRPRRRGPRGDPQHLRKCPRCPGFILHPGNGGRQKASWSTQPTSAPQRIVPRPTSKVTMAILRTLSRSSSLLTATKSQGRKVSA